MATFLFLALSGLPFCEINDDIRLLDRRSPMLAGEEQSIRRATGGFETSKVFVVSGATEQEVLERGEELDTLLEEQRRAGRIRGFQSISTFVPSVGTQQRRVEALRTFLRAQNAELLPRLRELGFRDRSIDGLVAESNADEYTPLTVQKFLASAASLPARHLWLGNVGPGLATLVTVDRAAPEANLGALALPPGVYFADTVADTSDILRTYRRHATVAIVTFYVLILLFVFRRYGLVAGGLAFVPALLAALVSLSTQGLFGQAINLFSVLSVLIILGIGIDFALFLLEGKDEENATMLAVVLSGMSTLLSLALLAFCSSPVLRSFGQSLFFGTATAVILAPIVLYREEFQRRRRR